MVLNNCVKISYKGLTRQIVCDKKFQYDDLLKTAMDTFNIANSSKTAIEFYDEQGHKFNKETFEYLLLLFPNPQKLFFIRLDSTKMPNASRTEDTLAVARDEERLPFGKSNLDNRQKTTSDDEELCEAVPVRRQNCFLGELPGLTSTQTPSSSMNRERPDYLPSGITTRMHLLKQSPLKKKHLNNPKQFQRSLRI